ncbi:MAG: hypothetical protein J6J27_02220 [Alphaproteobacteria bacterium]|nr:hypothetical protein [Alphaproteobacteria bacterium]
MKTHKNNVSIKDIHAFNKYIQNSGNVLPYMLASLMKNGNYSNFSLYIKNIKPYLDDKSLALCLKEQKNTEKILQESKEINFYFSLLNSKNR